MIEWITVWLEAMIQKAHQLPVWQVLLWLGLTAFLENIVPPIPGDLIVVFGGALVGLGICSFLSVFVSTAIGSVVGFAVLYVLAYTLGAKLLHSRLMRLLGVEDYQRSSHWMTRYGLWIVVVNRFLAGTRAIISVMAGILRLPPARTLLAATVSAGLWNLILIYAGLLLGKNWRNLSEYLKTYSTVVIVLLVGLGGAWAIHFWMKHRSPKSAKISEDT